MEHETKKIEAILVERISTEGTQARAALSETIITEYGEALLRGEEFPPIEVYFDDRTYWLADGFHRLGAAKLARQSTITAVVRPGGRREALLYAVGANETHGLRRTDADRRQAVMLLFGDLEWQLWSNNEIARQCHVSDHLVRLVRRELKPARETKAPPEQTRKVTRGGKTYTMRTGKIGAASPGKSKTPAVVTALPVRPGQQSASAHPGPAPASSTRSKIDTTPVAPPPEPAPQPPPAASSGVPPEPHTDVPALAPSGAPAVTPEPPEQPPVASYPQTEDSRLTTLVRAWSDASLGERQTFVTVHQAEMRALLAAVPTPEPEPVPGPRAARRRPAQKKEKA